ncbi:hypothetical protein MPSEU_000673600 [Mayamaea pseudoterrestris]|nr:hypothetical protein MPSEU_000673600 [Mayamaea pseudoterrestris]
MILKFTLSSLLLGSAVAFAPAKYDWRVAAPQISTAFQSPLQQHRRQHNSDYFQSHALHSSPSKSTRLYSDASYLSDKHIASHQEEPTPKSLSSGTGTATISQEVFNLVKAIVGAGVLTLPSGIAAFGSAPSAVVPAVALIALVGSLSAYGFGLIGRVCSLTRSTSYKAAWEETVGTKSAWIPAWSVTLKTVCATLAYSMILADTFHALIGVLVPGMTKSMTLAAVTTFILLPLCLLRNLSSLAPFSLLGSLGMVYTTIAMGIRYFGGAYAKNGVFSNDLPKALRPAFGNVGAAGALTPQIAILIGMLSTAYMAHFNAPKFYAELKNNTVPRYMTVVATSFAASISIFATMASLGFLTFGSASSGLILNNYSPRDTLMGLSKAAVAIAIVGSYPLAFVGARDGVLDLLKLKQSNMKAITLNILTVAMLGGLTVAASVIPDVSFVLAFAGATLGNALIYIYPALMFRGAMKKIANPTKLQQFELKASAFSAILGLGFGIMGAVKAVQSIM